MVRPPPRRLLLSTQCNRCFFLLFQELNWDTNGLDAVEGLSAAATRPYIDHLLPCPDAKPARVAAPLRRVRDGWQRCQIAREALLITIEERAQEA